MVELILEKEYPVNSININVNKKLGLFGILGMIQDAAAIHGQQLGLGADMISKNNCFWVLVQQKLKMTAWPKWQDVVRIRTWPRSPQKAKTYRDSEIFLGDSKIGECVTTWMMLDGTTRRPVRLDADVKFGDYPADCLDFIPDKIIMPEEASLEKTLEVRNSDLDMNYHVNNTKYSQWLLDTIPLKYHSSVKLDEFEINFMAETHLGDKIDIFASPLDDVDPPGIGHYYRGVRHADDKVVFVAKMKGTASQL